MKRTYYSISIFEIMKKNDFKKVWLSDGGCIFPILPHKFYFDDEPTYY